jgi:hypothetical protein
MRSHRANRRKRARPGKVSSWRPGPTAQAGQALAAARLAAGCKPRAGRPLTMHGRMSSCMSALAIALAGFG